MFKIANQKWSDEFLQMQTNVLGYLKERAPDLVFPNIVLTSQGQSITYVDGFGIRLLTYLEGDLFTHTPKSPELYQDIGRFMGQFSAAMVNYSAEVAEGSDELWKLDNVMACKDYLPEVIDADAKDRIARLYEVYEEKILPKLSSLRKAVIHGDANEPSTCITALRKLDNLGNIFSS